MIKFISKELTDLVNSFKGLNGSQALLCGFAFFCIAEVAMNTQTENSGNIETTSKEQIPVETSVAELSDVSMS